MRGGIELGEPEPILFGFCVLAIVIFIWRWIVHNIDRQIVELYPRMIQLEADRKWEVQTRYYFNNLADRSIEYLSKELLHLDFKLKRYEDFVEEAKKQGQDKYELLLSLWREFRGFYSVTDRGHKKLDKAAFLVVCIFPFGIALIIYPLFIYLWGQNYGWWGVKIVRAEKGKKK